MRDADRIAGIVNEWFQTLPTTTEQQRDRSALIADLVAEFERLERVARETVGEEIATAIESRIRTWPGMSQQAEAGNENLRQAARIAREHGKES